MYLIKKIKVCFSPAQPVQIGYAGTVIKMVASVNSRPTVTGLQWCSTLGFVITMITNRSHIIIIGGKSLHSPTALPQCPDTVRWSRKIWFDERSAVTFWNEKYPEICLLFPENDLGLFSHRMDERRGFSVLRWLKVGQWAAALGSFWTGDAALLMWNWGLDETHSTRAPRSNTSCASVSWIHTLSRETDGTHSLPTSASCSKLTKTPINQTDVHKNVPQDPAQLKSLRLSSSSLKH